MYEPLPRKRGFKDRRRYVPPHCPYFGTVEPELVAAEEVELAFEVVLLEALAVVEVVFTVLDGVEPVPPL